MIEILIVECPNCRWPMAWIPESKYRLFCDEHCKLINLGKWADEKYTAAAQEEGSMLGQQES